MTDQQIATPSCNPSNRTTLKGAVRVALAKFLQNEIDDMLPAQVISYNRATNMATVQPLISSVTTLGTVVQRGQLSQIPVLQIGGGGFVLNFPIKTGDLGWLKTNDRDISFFKQVWSLCIPSTRRMHKFSDAIFIPSILTGLTIQMADSDDLILQSLDGTTAITMGGGKVNIRAPNGVFITSPSVNASGDITWQYGTSDISGTNHVHSGVETGPSDTGPPVT